MDIQKFQNKSKVQLLRAYVSGVSVEILEKRYGYKREKIYQIAEEFRTGIIDIFDDTSKNRIMDGIESRDEEVQRLKNEIALLKNDLKMANITIEGYQIMQRICKEEYGIDLSKKSGAGSSKSFKKTIKE